MKRQANSTRCIEGPRTARAFTLIELLVVVAVIAILIGILLPALGRARSAAFSLQDQNMQRQMILGMNAYFAENDQWIPGINTSGRRLVTTNSATDLKALTDKTGRATQAQDWISPSLALEGLPAKREHRLYQTFDQFSDPAQRERNPVWTSGPSGNTEMATWINDFAAQPLKSPSYMMTSNFVIYGSASSSIDVFSSSQRANLEKVVRVPKNYRPRADAVGSQAIKVAIADGYRYWANSGSSYDFTLDCSYSGTANYGVFTDRSPCDMSSTSWGRYGSNPRIAGNPLAETGLGITLSYRHGGKLNVTYFDGHGESIDRKASRNPSLWSPRGSTMIGASGTDPDAYLFGFTPRPDENIIN